MILYPRKENKPAKKSQVPEATTDKLNSAEAKMQNTVKGVIELPKKEIGYSFDLTTPLIFIGLLLPYALEGCEIIFLPTLFVSFIFLIDFPFE